MDEVFANFWDGFCVKDPKCSYIASHLHFNYMFMHFRYVITMLNCCVLVGLDWAEPMMFLMLHVICSCIFHAYIPNFVSIILILNCLVLFCMSLSLSPFFSLALVCSMTPKHKSTPSWNPLHSRASSSSSSPLIALHLTSSSMMIKPIRNF